MQGVWKNTDVLWEVGEDSGWEKETAADKNNVKEVGKKRIFKGAHHFQRQTHRLPLADLIIFQHSVSQGRAPQFLHVSSQNLRVILDMSHSLIHHMQCITITYQYASEIVLQSIHLSDPLLCLHSLCQTNVISCSDYNKVLSASILHASILAHSNWFPPSLSQQFLNFNFNLSKTLQSLSFCS